jgi:hypothetical protein
MKNFYSNKEEIYSTHLNQDLYPECLSVVQSIRDSYRKPESSFYSGDKKEKLSPFE